MTNVVWFCADQMRYDSVDCLGNPTIRTPNIGAIGGRGVRFHNHYTPCQSCSPSRATMFTGLYPRHHGLYRNGIALDETLSVVPRTLVENGFRTHGVGKFHLQPLQAPADRRMPESLAFWEQPDAHEWRGPYYGFETIDMMMGEGEFCLLGGHYPHWLRTHHPEVVDLYAAQAALSDIPDDLFEVWKMAVPQHLHYNFWIADNAVNFIDEANPSQSNFLYVSFPDLHHPFTPPKPYCDLYDPKDMPPPSVRPGELDLMPSYVSGSGDSWAEFGSRSYADVPDGPVEQGAMRTTDGISEATMRLVTAHTYGMIEMIDDAVGRVIDALRRKDMLKDTVLMFTTDHGEFLGDHGLLRKGPPPYRAVTHVPMLMSGPGIPQGAEVDTLTSHVDIFATLCDYLDIAAPVTDGESLLPLIRGTGDLTRDALYGEYHTRAFAEQYNLSLVTDRWRLTIYPENADWGELFDLENDPGEHQNLCHAPAAQTVARELRDRLIRQFPPFPKIDSEILGLY